MEENRYEYEPEEGYDYENEISEEREKIKKSLLGYRVVIIILAIILAGVSVLYFNINREQQANLKLMESDRDSIQSNLSNLIVEYDDLKYKNDTIAAQLTKANEVMEQLKRERSWNYAKIKAYQKEVGTLRAVMKNYLRQIDSLNTLNKKVIGENVSLRKEVSSANLRADKADERAKELQNKVQMGSVLRARGINIVALGANDKPVTRVKRATTLRVDFTIGANDIAAAGNRMIYLCITSPDGYVLTKSAGHTFTYQGGKKSYSAAREVDYQNEDLDVSIFYKDEGFTPGAYRIALYMNGGLIGSSEVDLR